MSLYIEHKYVNLLASKLEKFVKKSARLYNCRCPICLDSKKNKNKARGYFYVVRNRINYKCHNCHVSRTLGTLMKELDPSLYRQYIYERFAAGENGHSNYKKPDEAELFKDMTKKIKVLSRPVELFNLKSIKQLPDDHYAKTYVESRLIPKKFWSRMFFAPDFKQFVEKLTPSKYDSLRPKEARLVIPFFTKSGKLLAVQGRAFGEAKLRYITIKVLDDEQKIFGLDKVDFDKDYYIVEGPIDSMFIPNCIAAAGADISYDTLPKNGTFIYDNERGNREIVERMKDVVQQGYGLFIWPPNWNFKDVNKAIESGITPEEFMEMVEKRTYRGLAASAMIGKWLTIRI